MVNNVKSVVIIDDSRTTLLLLENLIYDLSKNMEIHSFDKSEKGFQYLQNHTPDLILLDLRMPKVTGYEILEDVKKRMLTPVFVISAESKVGSIERAYMLGADGFFSKPLDIKKLKEKLKQALFAEKYFF